MRRYLYIIVTMVLSFVSCSDTEEESYVERGEDDVVGQTTIMYFMGTSLKSNYFDVYNIPDTRSAVAAGALGKNGRLLIFLPSSSSATLYEIYQTTGGYATETIAVFTEGYDSKISTTQDFMVEVLEMSKEFAPADTYNLILSGHGTGWVLQSHPDLKSVESDSAMWDKRDDVDVETRFMGSSTDGYMEVAELRGALEQTATKYGYILFDMCFMSNIESIYELKGVCDNVVASPCEVMAFGFPYKTVLPELFTDDGSSFDLEAACYAFYEYYENLNTYPSGAVAWCQTDKLEGVASALKRINEFGVNSVNINSLQCYENLTSNVYFDLGHYVSEACADESLLGEFETAMELAFPARYHTDQFYTALKYNSSSWDSGRTYWVDIDDENFSGVSTSEPSTKFTDEWAETSWALATAATVESESTEGESVEGESIENE